MGKIKKFLSVMISICCVAAAIPGLTAMADSSGDLVVTLGADLSAEQKTTMLKYFGIEGQDVKTLTVTNAEERDLLSDFVSLEEIGSRTYSCALVQPTSTGGIQVKTANLTYVSSDMIASALSTCGIVNCQVLAASPFAVSGTGALTGILMSYEEASGKKLNQKKVKAATREVITTARFGRRHGRPKATLIVNRAKIQVLQKKVTNVKEITNIINNVSVDLNVTLTDDEVDLLTDLLLDISDLDYTEEEVGQIQDNLDQVEENATAELDAVDSDEDDILMNTDDSALGDDASFDSTGIMPLSLPITDEQMEYESEMGFEDEEETDAEEESEFEIESELLSVIESESEEASELESEFESELESETESEAEETAEAAELFFNTDESILGDDVAIDMTIPETDQAKEEEPDTIEAEESEEETDAEAEEESEKETDAEAEEDIEEETDADSGGETEEETEAEEPEESSEGGVEEAIPADPSAFLPEAQTEAVTEAVTQEEQTSFVLGGDDMPKEESTDNTEEPAADEETASDDNDNLFKTILADVVDDSSNESSNESSNDSSNEISNDTSSEDMADDADSTNDFASIFEDSDSSGEESNDTSDAAVAAPFTAADLSFSPNGTTVEPDLSTLTISCPAGGLSAGGGSLSVCTSDGTTVASVPMSGASVSDSSASVYIGAVLSPNTSYYVVLSGDALRKDGVSLEGTSSGSWTFSTSGSDEPEEAVEGEEGYDEWEDDWSDDWSDDWGDDWDDDWDW